MSGFSISGDKPLSQFALTQYVVPPKESDGGYMYATTPTKPTPRTPSTPHTESTPMTDTTPMTPSSNMSTSDIGNRYPKLRQYLDYLSFKGGF